MQLCGETKRKAAFTVGQWNRTDADRVCRECTARHNDAGEPYQCSICKLWFSEEAFPVKHRRNANSFYRVCLACELRKPCFRCNVKKPDTEYSAAAWKARHADRRVCAACAGAQRGRWTCAACGAIVSKLNFTTWCRHRPSGQNGTQVCDECYRARTLTCIAVKARGRLRKRRTTIRRREILQEVRAEVESMARARRLQPQLQKTSSLSQTEQQTVTGMETERTSHTTKCRPSLAATKQQSANRRKRKYPSHGSETGSNGTRADAMQKMPRIPKPPQDKDRSHISQHRGKPHTAEATTWVKYQCLYCEASIESTTKNGTVNVGGHCGKQFRVRNGQVCRGQTHACPKCGAKVQSARARGQIKCSHKKPNGKACSTTRWYVK